MFGRPPVFFVFDAGSSSLDFSELVSKSAEAAAAAAAAAPESVATVVAPRTPPLRVI
jgi:hypothetical protein